MATSTIKYNGCTINGVQVSPGNNYTSYDLHFWRDITVSNFSTKNIPLSTWTNVGTVSVDYPGTYFIFARIQWPASNKRNGQRRARITYSCTLSDGTTSSATIGTNTIRPSQGNMVAYLPVYGMQKFGSTVSNIVFNLDGYQSGDAQITMSGILQAFRI